MNRFITTSGPVARLARTVVAACCVWAAWIVCASGADAGKSLDIHDMRLANEADGWLAGTTQILRTHDAGLNWSDATPSIADLARIDTTHFLDANQAWLIATTRSGTMTLAQTRDGGASWVQHLLPRELVADGAPLSLYFADARNGWLMLRAPSSSNFQRGTLLRTRDAGSTWTVLPTPPIIGRTAFVSADTGWLAGGLEHDRLYMTRDGGETWLPQALPGFDGARRAVTQVPRFRNAREGTLAIAVEEGASSQALMYNTDDGGSTWSLAAKLPLWRELDAAGVALSVPDAQTFVFAQAGEVVLQQAGASRSAAPGLPQGGAIVALDFSSDARGWLLQRRGECLDYKTNCREETRLFATDDMQGVRDVTPISSVDAAGQPDSVFISHNHKGFDQCAAGTVSQMQAWWTSTPWSDANIYIGGENSACDTTNDARLTPTWIKSVLAQGWHLIPTWVGKQAPTSGCGGCSKHSTDSVTARAQGIAEANAAVAKARAIGLQIPTVIYYDMEGYSGTSAATAAFLDGWTARMHELNNTSGIYGGAGNASTDWYGVANRADAVWIAAWNGQASVFGIAGLADSKWANQQRIHQYQGGHDETWNGVTFNIDSNYEDGPVADLDCIFCDGFQ